ncbi:MAG: hypothetical protein IMZ65_01940 [Planctomycetes bacterium]|nr:hypothetical protein [Planctomycetota bacterium]
MRALMLAPCLLAASIPMAAAQVTVVRTFPGMDGPNPPPITPLSSDMMGGVSPKYLVGFINAGFSVRLKIDGRDVQPVQTLHEFWAAAFKNAGRELYGTPYDPRIFYDPLSSRWFATSDSVVDDGKAMHGTSHMLLAVSQDDDPTHPWKAVDTQATILVDNIKLGLDKNGVYLTALAAITDKAIPMIAIPKTDLLWTGTGVPSLAHLNYFETPKTPADPARGTHGSRGDEGMIPAFDLNPHKKLGDPMIFINRFQAEWAGETAMQIRKVTWTSPTKATMTGPVSVGLGVTHTAPTTQAMQPPLPQKGLVSPPIRPGGGRLVNAVVSRGSVWAIAATDVNHRTGAFWVEIDLRTMKLVQHGTVGDPAADIVFASLNVDVNGNLGMAMNRSSASDYLSIYVTGRLASDPPNTLRPLVKAVEGRYVFIPKAWNLSSPGNGTGYMDFSTVVVDPSDPTLFWTYQEVPTHDCMPVETNGGKFGTAFVAFRVGQAPS